MEHLAIFALLYLAAGAACFAHPGGPATPADFTWRGQRLIFLDTLPAVLAWPMALWYLCRGR
ncbi:MAG TPA: hypothetical protein VFA50_08390 [Stellaceae bacterium]|nr:hypothetical protein [Stellaceae bacterium]